MASVKRLYCNLNSSEVLEDGDIQIHNTFKNQSNPSKVEKRKLYNAAPNKDSSRDAKERVTKNHNSNRLASPQNEPKCNGKRVNNLMELNNSKSNDAIKKPLPLKCKKMNLVDNRGYSEEEFENKNELRLNNSKTKQKDKRDFLMKLSYEFENEEAKPEIESCQRYNKEFN